MTAGFAFLDAALLAGLAALAVPAVIHLISKRRARRVRFAPLELLLRSQRRTARSIRLRQILLLLVRTLLVMCIALAIARPLWRQDHVAAKTTPLVVIIAIDVSASMRATIDRDSAFERAQRLALDIAKAQPLDVRVGAVVCAEAPRDVAAPDFDRAAVSTALSSLQPGFGYADLGTCVAHASGLALAIAGEGERRVVVVSDLAAHGFSSQGPAVADGRGVVIDWMPVSKNDPPPNHGLSDVAVERAIGRTGDVLEVAFTARRFGGAPTDVSADLMVDDVRTARLSLPLAAGVSAQRVFHHALSGSTLTGGQELAVVLGDDALAEDNAVRLPFSAPAPLAVLVVNGAPQPVPFRDEVFYLENALRDARGGASRLAVNVVGFDRVTPADIARARVIVLANVRTLEQPVAAALTQHVTAGAGLFVGMGDQVDVEWYNSALGELLPAPLRGIKGQALLDDSTVAEVLGLTRFRTNHPVLQSMAAADAEELPGLGRVRTHTLMLLEPGGEAAHDVLMRYSNDAPALLERAVGEGRVLFFATSLDRDWTDLAIRPGFLPLMRQSVLYLGGALENTGPRVIHVGQSRTIRVPRGVESMEVEPPSAPRQVLTIPPEAQDVSFTATQTPGIYRVWTRAPGGEARERVEERFAVVIPPMESDLTRASPELLVQNTPQGAVSRAADTNDSDMVLWPWLMLLGVVAFVLESTVLFRGARAG